MGQHAGERSIPRSRRRRTSPASPAAASIEEHHRRRCWRGFEWRAHNPKAKREHRSFWIWSAYSYLQSFERIAREWLKYKGDQAGEKTFANDTTGKAYHAQGEAPPWEKLRDRANASHYPRGKIPPARC
jgi:phage terminase large subunit GpA-like protein